MKSTIIYLALILCFTNTLVSQDIKNKFCIEKILLNEKIDLKELRSSNIVFTQRNNYVIHTNSSKKKHTVSLTIIDSNLNANYLDLYIPDNIEIDHRSGIFSIGVGKEKLFVFYGTFYFIFEFNITKKTASFEKIVYIHRNYNNYYVIDDSTFISSFVYNTSLPQEKVIISKFRVNESEPMKSISPKFDCIEFSHFAPNHWIEIKEKYIAFSQACDYRINIYNHSLDLVDSITLIDTNWVKMNNDTLDILRKHLYGSDPHFLIKKLNSFNNKISKVEGVWFINETDLLIRYYMPKLNQDTNSNLPQVFFDGYRIKQNNGETVSHEILFKRFMDGSDKLNVDDTVGRCNTYVLSWMHPSFFLKNYIIVLKPTGDIDYFNKPLREILKKQNESFVKSQPKTGLWIYKKSW